MLIATGFHCIHIVKGNSPTTLYSTANFVIGNHKITLAVPCLYLLCRKAWEEYRKNFRDLKRFVIALLWQ